MAEEEVRNWADLPYHLLELIINNLMIPETSDYIRCGAVCKSWRTVFLDHPHPLQPPFLIVPTLNSYSTTTNEKTVMSSTNTKSISFYNIIHQKVYNQFQITIPSGWHFRGSSHGWLVVVDEDNDCQVRLFNPFLTPSPSSEILLPSLKHLPRDNVPCNVTHGSPSTYAYLRKAVLSADPLLNPTDYVVMAIFGPLAKLAYYRPTTGGDGDGGGGDNKKRPTTGGDGDGGDGGGGDNKKRPTTGGDGDGGGGDNKKRWTPVKIIDSTVIYSYQFRDVIYRKGKFFALHHPGREVMVFDPERDMEVTVLKIQQAPRWSRLEADIPDTEYLVESSANLLQIRRYIQVGEADVLNKRHPYSTFTFRVFNLGVNDDGKLKWVQLKNLGDRTLFLGNSDTISICASNYPGCKPNSIYFTDDFMDYYYKLPWNGPHDLGVFHLEDERIENHYPTDHETPIWPIPIWIEPSVQKK